MCLMKDKKCISKWFLIGLSPIFFVLFNVVEMMDRSLATEIVELLLFLPGMIGGLIAGGGALLASSWLQYSFRFSDLTSIFVFFLLASVINVCVGYCLCWLRRNKKRKAINVALISAYFVINIVLGLLAMAVNMSS